MQYRFNRFDGKGKRDKHLKIRGLKQIVYLLDDQIETKKKKERKILSTCLVYGLLTTGRAFD